MLFALGIVAYVLLEGYHFILSYALWRNISCYCLLTVWFHVMNYVFISFVPSCPDSGWQTPITAFSMALND